jgi:[citrate (pro-3S)-lyase] ligase
MWADNFQEQVINLKLEFEKRQVEEFLAIQGLALDKDLEYTVALLDGSKIVATGSFGGRILKCIAVAVEYQNMGLANRIITQLVNEQYRRGRTHLFVYTKPKNKMIFLELGFYAIAEVPSKVILMENRPDGIQKYLEEISAKKGNGQFSAAVVVNCNPFTLGHQYLINYAASKSEWLHVFVLWEDRSAFPAEIRYRMVVEGVGRLPNVVVHRGKDYIISDATFPSYFIKEYQDYVETHARLDLAVFTEYIAPVLNIKKRFVGEEPCCAVTATYNRIMKETLPTSGIDVEEVPRILRGGREISASRVRGLIKMGEIGAVKELVPETTYKLLLSSETRAIIDKIKTIY